MLYFKHCIYFKRWLIKIGGDDYYVRNKKYNYLDITNQYLKINNKNYKVLIKKYYVKDKIKYKVDKKNVVLDFSKKEYDIAIWLSETFKENVSLNPRINKPEGIKTADYIFKKEKWDLKTITGSSEQVIYHAIKNSKDQSNNFIVDITKSNLSLFDAKKYCIRLFTREDTNFLKNVIVKKENSFIVLKKRM